MSDRTHNVFTLSDCSFQNLCTAYGACEQQLRMQVHLPRDIKNRRVIDFLRTPLISAHHTVSAYFFNIPGKTTPPPTPYLRPCPMPGHTAYMP